MSNNRRPSTNQRQHNIIISKLSPDTQSLDSEDIDPNSHDYHTVRHLHGTNEDESTSSLGNSKYGEENSFVDDKPKSEKLGNGITRSNTLLSRITTIKFDDSLIVPVKERRGLLSKLCLIPEYQDARNLPASLRRVIVFIIAFCAMLGPMGTSILLPASDNAVEDLGTTITILNVAIGVYLITLGVIPLWWSNLSERHGRRSIYVVSFILYLCFTIGCALANNVNTLIGFRVLSGGCAASVQSVGAGTIGDLYPITKRGAAMGLFYLGPLAGPLLSPIIGGAITSNKKFGWRATQWFLICLSGGCCLLIIFFLPETLRKQDNREAIRQILRDRRRNKIVKKDEETAIKETKDIEKVTHHDNDQIIDAEVSQSNPSKTINNDLVLDNESPLSPVGSIDSNVFDEDDNDKIPVDEEEVEHLNKLLTRMSTHRSIVEISNKGGDINRSRKSSFASVKPKSRKPSVVSGNAKIQGTLIPSENEMNYEIKSIDSGEGLDKEEIGHDEDDNYEMPVMDSVVPLSKVPTATTIKHQEMKKSQKSKKLADELETIHKIAHGSKFKLFLHYTKIYLYGPLKSFVFIRYPPVALAMAYSAPCFAALYVQNMTLTYMYSRPPYNFSPVLVGLVYIPNSVTYFIASIWGGKFNDYLLKKKIEKYGIVAPEARFGINVYVAAAMLPLSLLITGWCLEYHEQWVTPLIGTALFGFAQMIVIGVTVTYLADCLPGRGATGIALNNFIRMIMAAGVSFATEPLIKAIGTGVLFSICAGVTAVLSILIVIIIRNGDHWRETYDLEKLYDIVDA